MAGLLKTDAQPVPKDSSLVTFSAEKNHQNRSGPIRSGPRFQDTTAQWHPLNLALQRKVGTTIDADGNTYSNMKT